MTIGKSGGFYRVREIEREAMSRRIDHGRYKRAERVESPKKGPKTIEK